MRARLSSSKARSWAACFGLLMALTYCIETLAQQQESLSGISMEIGQQGGQAVAVIRSTLPSGQDMLTIPAFFEGRLYTTRLKAFFNGQRLRILSGITNAAPPGSDLYIDDLNYILLDVRKFAGKPGNLRLTLKSEFAAELFILEPDAELPPAPIEVPVAPVDLTATRGIQSEYVEFSWLPPAGATHYKVVRSEKGSGRWEQLTGTRKTAIKDRTTTPGTRYRYRVRACNSAGCSALSKAVAGYR